MKKQSFHVGFDVLFHIGLNFIFDFCNDIWEQFVGFLDDGKVIPETETCFNNQIKYITLGVI